MEVGVFFWIVGVGLQTLISVLVGGQLLVLATAQTDAYIWGWFGLILLMAIDLASILFWVPCLKKVLRSNRG